MDNTQSPSLAAVKDDTLPDDGTKHLSGITLEATSEARTQLSRKELFEHLLSIDPTGTIMDGQAENEQHVFFNEATKAASLMRELSEISNWDRNFYAKAVEALSKGETPEHRLTHSLFAPYVQHQGSLPDDQDKYIGWEEELSEAEAKFLEIGESVFYKPIILAEARELLYDGHRPNMTEAWSVMFGHGENHQGKTIYSTVDFEAEADEGEEAPSAKSV